MKGDMDGAIADFDQAIKLDPREALAFYNRGNAKWHNRDYEGARLDYDATLRIRPDHANAYYKRGLAWLKRGDLDRGIIDLNKVIDMNPQDASAMRIAPAPGKRRGTWKVPPPISPGPRRFLGTAER